jgi:hypothetical protein
MELRCPIDSYRTLLPFTPHLISFPDSHACIDVFLFNVLVALCSEGDNPFQLEVETHTVFITTLLASNVSV